MSQINDDRRVHQLLLSTLEQLLALPAVDLESAMNQAAQLVGDALKADKVDAFLYEPAKNTLRALGTSNTPLGRLQVAQGLDILPVANGGSVVKVYETGESCLCGHADQLEGEVPGLVHALGVRSHIAVVLMVAGERRGVLSVQSQTPEYFSAEDLRFLQAVAHWIGEVAHRAELVEASTAAARASGRREVTEELILVLAHDLRNYLGTLQLHAEILKQRAVKEQHVEYVRDAELLMLVIERLTRLVVDLLDVGRLEQGIFALQPGPVDFMKLAHETARALATPHIAVHVSGPPALTLRGDPDRLRQTLENLVGNAIKHSPKGKTVLVKIHTETQHGSMVQKAIVEVADQGPGVPPEILPHLFERFARAGSAQGLGLGLYLANRIALAHGGTLAVSSNPGGASFQLVLPIDGPPAILDALIHREI